MLQKQMPVSNELTRGDVESRRVRGLVHKMRKAATFIFCVSFFVMLPLGFNKAEAATFYLDGVNGNDSTADGTITLPYKTYAALAAAQSVTASTVIIYPATYTEQLFAEGADVIFQASNWVAGQHLTAAQMPVFSNSGGTSSLYINRNNITVRGIAITGQSASSHFGVETLETVSGLLIEDCLIYDNFYGLHLMAGGTIRRCRFDGNISRTIYSSGITNGSIVNFDSNILTSNGGVGIWVALLDGTLNIRNNTLYGYDGSGVYVYSSSGDGIDGFEMKNNFVGGGVGEGYIVKFSSGMTIAAASIDYNYFLGGGDAAWGGVGGNYLNADAATYNGGHNIQATWPAINSMADNPGVGNISFDDAGNSDGQFPQIVNMLDYMNTKDMHGTWYVDFRNVGNNPGSSYDWNTSWAAIKAAYDDGAEIAGHSLNHWQTTVTNLFKFSRTGCTDTCQAVITNNGTSGSIAFQEGGVTVSTVNFTAPSDAALLANSSANDIAWLKTQLPANWTVTSQDVQVSNTLLLVELNAGTFAATPSSEAFVTPLTGGYVSGPLTTANGIYYWELQKAKDILEQKMAELGAVGYTCKSFAYPAWTSDNTAKAAVKAAGYTSARVSGEDGSTKTNKLTSYTAYGVGLGFMPADIWNSGIELPQIRSLFAQAVINHRVFNTMFHGYGQFNASGTLADFQAFIDVLDGFDLSMLSQGEIVDNIMTDTATWETLDGGYTYTLKSGVKLPDNTDFTFSTSSVLYNAGTAVTGITTDYYNKPVFGTIDIGAFEYQPPKTITSFNFASPAVTGTVNQANHTIALTVPYGTNVTALVPTIVIQGSSVSPNTGVAQNFTNPVTYTVTAADATTQAYTVTVTVAAASSDNTLSGLSISSGTLSPAFASGTTSYTASVANDVTSITVTPTVNESHAAVTVSAVSVSSGSASDSISLSVGANAIPVVVTAQNGTTRTYTVTVTRAASSTKAITAFIFASPDVAGTINEASHTIAITVPSGTVVTALVPTITITGASVSPNTGVAQNFTSPVTYTVTAADATTQAYTVTVTVTSSSSGGGSVSVVKPAVAKAEITKVEGNAVTLSLSVTNASSMIFSDNSGFTGASWENYAASKIYTKQDSQTKIYVKFRSSKGTNSSVVTLNIPSGSDDNDDNQGGDNGSGDGAGNSSYPAGTLLKLPDSPKVYVVIEGKKKWISTPEVFEQLGYKWTSITTVSQEQLNTLSDFEDNLIRAIGDYKVYLVVNGVKRHIPNPQIFLGYGFKWSDIKEVDSAILMKYADAYLVRESGKEEIYYLRADGIRKHIPAADIFNSYADKWEDIQVVSAQEMANYPLSQIIRLSGSNDIYFIQGKIKKRIASPETFKRKGFSWEHVMNVNQAEFGWYADGGVLE